MSKILKIILIFTFIFCINFCYCLAETTNLYNDVTNEDNTTSNPATDNSTDTSNTDHTNEDSFEEDNQTDLSEEEPINPYARTNATPASNNSARVSTVSSISEANLGLNNILCIILIALGILLTLLAIAILIRLKK